MFKTSFIPLHRSMLKVVTNKKYALLLRWNVQPLWEDCSVSNVFLCPSGSTPVCNIMQYVSETSKNNRRFQSRQLLSNKRYQDSFPHLINNLYLKCCAPLKEEWTNCSTFDILKATNYIEGTSLVLGLPFQKVGESWKKGDSPQTTKYF